jgi:hypothetical protein
MIGVLGSEEAFYYQYGTKFAASNDCLVSRECISKLRDRVKLFENKIVPGLIILHPENLYFDPNYDVNNISKDWFVILCDLAEGGGGEADYTVFQIMKIVDDKVLQQIGYYRTNNLDIEAVSLEFWMLAAQLFNNDRCIISIEWNTYGDLFHRHLLELNEPTFKVEYSFRFNVSPEGLDMTRIVRYMKDVTAQVNNGKHKNRTPSTIPGIRWNGENKKTACALLRIELEKDTIMICDLITSGELENFEDSKGNGVFRASYGHDDLMMTLVQIPMVRETSKFKNLIEEFLAMTKYNTMNSFRSESLYDLPSILSRGNFGLY